MDRSIAETLGLSEVGVLAALAVVAVILALITRFVTARRSRQAAQAQTASAPPEPAAPAAPIVARCTLVNCDETTAALIIAIVADSMGDEFSGKQVTSIRQL